MYQSIVIVTERFEVVHGHVVAAVDNPVADVTVVDEPVSAAGVTTTARAVAQYCMLLVMGEAAAGKAGAASEGCIVRSRLVTVTLGWYAGVMDTDEGCSMWFGDDDDDDVLSCIFRFRLRVIGPILVMETLLLLDG